MCLICDDIGGICNTTTNECHCKVGYEHDRVGLRQNDCSLPIGVMPPVLCTALGLSVLALMFSVRGFRKAQGLARGIAFGNVCFSVVYLSVFVSMVADGFRLNAVGIFLTYVSHTSMSIAIYMVIYSMAIPLYKLAEYSDSNLRKGMVLVFVAFRVFGLVPAIAAMMAVEDKEWNTFLVIFLIFIGLELLTLVTGVLVIGYKMTSAVQTLIAMTPDNPNHATTQLYLKKLRRLMIQLAILGPICSLPLLIASFSILINGYMARPYFGAIVLYLIQPLVPVFLTIYATRQKVGDDHHDPAKRDAAVADAGGGNAKKQTHPINNPIDQISFAMVGSSYVTSIEENASKMPLGTEVD